MTNLRSSHLQPLKVTSQKYQKIYEKLVLAFFYNKAGDKMFKISEVYARTR